MTRQLFRHVEIGLWAAFGIYLLAVFINTAFDIREWSEQARQITAMFMLVAGLASGAIHAVSE